MKEAKLGRIYGKLKLEDRLELIKELGVEAASRMCRKEPADDIIRQIEKVRDATPDDQVHGYNKAMDERRRISKRFFEKVDALTDIYREQRDLELRRLAIQLCMRNLIQFFSGVNALRRTDSGKKPKRSDMEDAIFASVVTEDMLRKGFGKDIPIDERALEIFLWKRLESAEIEYFCANEEKCRRLCEIDERKEKLYENVETADDATNMEINIQKAELKEAGKKIIPVNINFSDSLKKLWSEQDKLIKDLKEIIGDYENLLKLLENRSRPLSEIIRTDITEWIMKSTDEHFYDQYRRFRLFA